jgi:hypothetical protein
MVDKVVSAENSTRAAGWSYEDWIGIAYASQIVGIWMLRKNRLRFSNCPFKRVEMFCGFKGYTSNWRTSFLRAFCLKNRMSSM